MKTRKHFDVIVVGGGAAGFAAALGAKKNGASVFLIERFGSLGGQAVSANVASYCGFFTRGKETKQIVYGIGEELLQKLKALGYYEHYRKSSVGNAIITLDIEATKFAFDLLAEDYDLEYLLCCNVIKATVEEAEQRIMSVTCSDDSGLYEFSADSFVDATGNGNLGFMAGAPFRFGDGNGGGYMSTRVILFDNIDPDVNISPAAISDAIGKAKADGIGPLTKESGIIVKLYPDKGIAILPSVFVSSFDAETFTKCEVNTRKQEFAYLEAFRKYMPGMKNARIASGGAFMGIRDTRHLTGEYELTAEDVIDAHKQDDAIACGAWPLEMHKELNKMASYVYVKEDDYYHIPLRCLKVKGLKNLWSAGRTISADQSAFASVRVMGIGFATGHAAGIAASLTKDSAPAYEAVKKELLKQNAYI